MRSNDNETSWAVLPQRAHLFEQIAFQLEAQIQNGRWKPGEMIPSEAELAKSFSVALGTMRRALQMLSEKGFWSAGRASELLLPTTNWTRQQQQVDTLNWCLTMAVPLYRCIPSLLHLNKYQLTPS